MCSTVLAGDYVCHDNGAIIGKHSSVDGADLVGCIKITRSEYEDITRFHKIVDEAVVEMTQDEKDAILQAEADAIALAEASRVTGIDDKMADYDMSGVKLTRVENAIDNIGNLNDAKKFLKRLVRYIANGR